MGSSVVCTCNRHAARHYITAPRDRKERENEWICGSLGLRHPNRGQLHPLRGSEGGGVSAPPARAQLPLSEGQRVASEAGLRAAQTAQLLQRVPSEAARCALNYAQTPPEYHPPRKKPQIRSRSGLQPSDE
eukprot:6645167-Prymnesium_polylepis.1